nr:glycosyl transferase [Bifidobacterium bifidum]
HTKLMINGTDYNSQNYQAVTQASDYNEAAKALQEAHYATDPDYAQKLISVIQTYKLYNYDK